MKFHKYVAYTTQKTAANSLALNFLKLYLIIPLINFYFQYLKFNTLFSTDRLCYIFIYLTRLITMSNPKEVDMTTCTRAGTI